MSSFSRRMMQVVAGILALSLLDTRSSLAQVHLVRAIQAREFIRRHDLALAHGELDSVSARDPEIRLEKGRLALYEGRCDESVRLLTGLDAGDEQRELLDVARGCARATAAIEVDRDPERGIEIYYQDEGDRVLTPTISETVLRAQEALSRDLGVDWPKPTRIFVVRDHLSLSAMTGLPYANARKTGIVAIAKWGHVTMLTPRASRHGFLWRDTLAHELTHLAVTRASGDRAPLWLQEGVAKSEETKWREVGPFDGRPDPDRVALRGIKKKMDLPLDRLGPSIAMLPNADFAEIAFAEVTSFVRYFMAHASPDALQRVLGLLREGVSVDDALGRASKRTLHEWDGVWRAYLRGVPAEDEAHASHAKTAVEVRDRARLVELLLAQKHAPEALLELNRVKFPPEDPSLRSLRAEVLLHLEMSEAGLEAVGEPKEVSGPYAPWWSVRARIEKRTNVDASRSLSEALSIDPYDVPAACLEEQTKSLCDAAKAYTPPPFVTD